MWEIGSPDWQRIIAEGAAAIGVDAAPAETDQFAAHARELIHWNRKTNLTTITDPYEMAIKHFVDSMAPVKWISRDAALLDIGSGGGFPGIPLKIMMPTLRVTLIDASRKKVSFLKQVIRSLGLSGIEAHHIRAEAFTAPPIEGNGNACFDIVISRALTALKPFFKLAVPLLAANGAVIAMKGKLSSEELTACGINPNSQGGSAFGRRWVLSVEKYRLPFVEAERTIVRLQEKARDLT